MQIIIIQTLDSFVITFITCTSMEYYINAKIIHILLSKHDRKFQGCQVETQYTFNLTICIIFYGKKTKQKLAHNSVCEAVIFLKCEIEMINIMPLFNCYSHRIKITIVCIYGHWTFTNTVSQKESTWVIQNCRMLQQNQGCADL